MKTRTGCLGLFAVVLAILLSGFGCVDCAGEAIHNTDAPLLLRVVGLVAGAVLLVACIALTYLLVGAGIEAWGESE